MNDQMTLPMVLADDAVTLDERAQRIRDLVGVARGCIIEIGRELVEARKQIRGEKPWEDWLAAEFGWAERQAYKFIAVATAFSAASLVTTDLTIEAGALYVLSAPEVSQAVRDAAIERAEAAFATKYDTVSHFTGLTIDATALYARCRGDPLLGPV